MDGRRATGRRQVAEERQATDEGRATSERRDGDGPQVRRPGVQGAGGGLGDGTQLPPLDPGVTVLEVPAPRSAALHRLAVDALADAGRAYWVDTGNTASTHALCDLAPSRRWLADLRVARAFTAYQHYALVREVVRRASPRTGLVVLPNLGALYRDDDVPDHEAEALLGAVVDALSTLGRDLDVPVLVTDAPGVRAAPGQRPELGETDGNVTAADALGELVRAGADAEIRCVETDEGYRYDADGFETTCYWSTDRRGLPYRQTTIPYWVEVCGAVGAPVGGAAVEAALGDGVEAVTVDGAVAERAGAGPLAGGHTEA